MLVQTYLIVTLIYVVNFSLSQLAVWLERRAGTRVRRNVAGSGGAGDAHAGSVGQDRSRAVDSGMTVKNRAAVGHCQVGATELVAAGTEAR